MKMGIVFLFLLLVSVTLGSAPDGTKFSDRLNAIEVLVRSQAELINYLQSEVKDLKQQLSKATASKNNAVSSRGTRAQGINIAFSAYLDHQIHHVGIDSIIPFNKMVLNDGGAFNNITGIFTTPVTGVYLFTYTVNTTPDVWQLVVKLVVDGVNVSDGTSDPKHDLQEIQGGNTVIVRVNQGQSVWLAAYNTGDTVVDGREDYRFTTLSGVLLYT